MDIQYKKAKPVLLSDVGMDEKWLQKRIVEDPSILGLGDLNLIERERIQPSGGRIDFVMYDPEDDTRYEIEVMLGTLDESHIIRTIEYWDIERHRYPSLEHRAVIVAEEITNRFFNVIGLLNKAVPIIAIQLNSFVLDNSLMLNFVKVLDITEPGDEDEGVQEQVNREYWESKANIRSLEVMDKLIAIAAKKYGVPKVTYNRSHVALGFTGYNFCWFHPRKGSTLHLHLKTGSDGQDKIVTKLQEKGIDCGPRRKELLGIGSLTAKQLDENTDVIMEAIDMGEKLSKR